MTVDLAKLSHDAEMQSLRTVTVTRHDLETIIGRLQDYRHTLWNDGRPAVGYDRIAHLCKTLAAQHPDCVAQTYSVD